MFRFFHWRFARLQSCVGQYVFSSTYNNTINGFQSIFAPGVVGAFIKNGEVQSICNDDIVMLDRHLIKKRENSNGKDSKTSQAA